MRRRRSRLAALLLCLSGIPGLAIAADRIGDIEFFGYKGLDVSKVRAALPIHEGEEFDDTLKDKVRQAIAGVVGKEPTDVAAICCDEKGHHLLFIGLPGASSKSLVFLPEPTGSQRLPSGIVRLYDRLNQALEAAVRRGGNAAEEDDSKGYALIKDPNARSLQLAVRRWAVDHEPQLLRVLEFSSSAEHRRIASDALGYGRQSRRQILALLRAASDADEDVRNNAARAISVLIRSKPALASAVEPGVFIQMVNSGVWTDRNKGAWALMQITAARNPAVLASIRAEALDSLTEMARWRRPGHAAFARMLLGRVAGIKEDRLEKLAWEGPVEAIIEAAGKL